MTEQGKRLSKALGAALAFHLAAAVLLGIFGYNFDKRPPQILEVTLAGGGGGSDAAEVVEEQPEPVVEKILPTLEDIIDNTLKPKPKPEPPKPKKAVQPAKKQEPGPAKDNTPSGEGQGTGSGSGEGTGTGTGSGDGDGDGAGSGHGVPATPPRLLSSTEPRYPASARNREIEGTVRVKMLVSDKGRVENAEVLTSSGSSDLDNAAVQSVYSWRFSPAKDGYGVPVRCYITMPVRFRLR